MENNRGGYLKTENKREETETPNELIRHLDFSIAKICLRIFCKLMSDNGLYNS